MTNSAVIDTAVHCAIGATIWKVALRSSLQSDDDRCHFLYSDRM